MRLVLLGWLVGVGCGRVSFDLQSDAVPDALTVGDVGPALACPPFADLCDGFESGDLSKWTSVEQSSNTTLVVSTARPHSGTRSLDADVPAAFDGAASHVVNRGALQSAGMRAIRAWFYAPQPLTNFDLVFRLANEAGGQYAAVGCDSDGMWVTSEAYASTGPIDFYSTTPCATNRWMCVELDYTFSPPHLAVYVDDALIIDIDAADPAPMFDEHHTGAVRADAAGFQILVDDVVIAQQHIGCM